MRFLLTSGAGVVTEFVEPVLFGCDEHIPGQQRADAHQKEDDVHQIVGVLRAVTGPQGPCRVLSGKQW